MLAEGVSYGSEVSVWGSFYFCLHSLVKIFYSKAVFLKFFLCRVGAHFLQQLVTMKGPRFYCSWHLQLSRVLTTTRGTPEPAHLPMDLTKQLQLGPVCPWSPPDADNCPECTDQVRNKRFCWLLLSHPSFQPLLSYPTFSCPPVLDTGIW